MNSTEAYKSHGITDGYSMFFLSPHVGWSLFSIYRPPETSIQKGIYVHLLGVKQVHYSTPSDQVRADVRLLLRMDVTCRWTSHRLESKHGTGVEGKDQIETKNKPVLVCLASLKIRFIWKSMENDGTL